MEKLILLVDDDYDYLLQTRIIVENFGFRVITADSQQEAEKILKNTRPDLAIVDLMMESEDIGFILSYKIKKLYPDVPVIIATSVSADTGIKFGLNTREERNWIKADQYLEKGIRHDQLQLKL